MLENEALKDLLCKSELTRKDKLLLVLATNNAAPRTVTQIRQVAVAHGLRAAKRWNISDILAKGSVHAIRTGAGWELSSDGKTRVNALSGASGQSIAGEAAVDLRAHLGGISSADTVAFLSEAITCLEARALRAAVVLAWVGAIAVLYDHAIQNALPAFNSEARRRDPKWKTASTADDLARMKEHEFLDIIESISIIGKNVKQELQGCLKLRNACGHPTSLQVGERKVSAHIETLILNVFQIF